MGSQTFDFTGGWQTFTIPDKVKNIVVHVYGAGTTNRRGGYVTGNLDTEKHGGEKLYIAVGGQGAAASGHQGGQGGWPNGGNGGDGIGQPGGDGGAGSTAIRWGSVTGQVVAVAAGAGGNSGDGGAGGRGGDVVGEDGGLGTSGKGEVGVATGGSQAQGGNGGHSSSVGLRFDGHNAVDSVLGQGGRGGTTDGTRGAGGGGGGGGYFSGGGGAGASFSNTPAGGGGGGSNIVGFRLGGTSDQAEGYLTDGQVVLEWQDPVDAGDSVPNNPSLVAPDKGRHLRDVSVTIQAKLTDSDSKNLRMRVEYSKHSDMRHSHVRFSDYIEYRPKLPKKKRPSNVAKLHLSELEPATHYYVRIWAEDDQGAESLGYTSTTFYTNFPPNAPTLHDPSDNVQFDGLSSTTFTWSHNDPGDQPQANAIFRYRRQVPGSKWRVKHVQGRSEQFVVDPEVFKPGHSYVWQVKTQDPAGLWGRWSDSRTFYVTGVVLPPDRLHPDGDIGVAGDDSITLRWRFRDGRNGNSMYKADIRYRIVGQGQAQWVTWYSSTAIDGPSHTFRPGTFVPGYHYEWQARTYDQMGDHTTPSAWSESATFHATVTPGRDAEAPIPNFSNDFAHTLGVGINRAFLVAKGGNKMLGELRPLANITWQRTRDGISKCNLTLDIKADRRTCALAADMRTWQHEVVVYRWTPFDGMKRVWEGPITRITYHSENVQVEAWDVLAWPYRRILKQGYDDSYPNNISVVRRAAEVLWNAYAEDDPNVLRYLTVLEYTDDAQSSRVRPDWSATAWEEIDELAAKHGLDYTVVGRRPVLWDTHRPLGRLPIMDNRHFEAEPVITEYGMNLATTYGVTNGSGLFGVAHRDDSYYGPIEILSSSYASKAGNGNGTLTQKAKDKLVESMDEQARRGIAHRWPAPLHVRLPDSTGMSPDAPVTIDYLVPGVWIPLRADHVCRTVTQWQKLSSVVVSQGPEGEKITVSMIPAPDSGNIPDLGSTSAAETATEGHVDPSYVISGTVPKPAPPPPPDDGLHDHMSTALRLAAGTTTYTQSTAGATVDADEYAPNLIGATVWFKWYPPAGWDYSQPPVFDTIGSNFDTQIAAYIGDGTETSEAWTGADGFDDDGGGNSTSKLTLFSFDATKTGKMVWLQVGGFQGATGTLVLNYPAPG